MKVVFGLIYVELKNLVVAINKIIHFTVVSSIRNFIKNLDRLTFDGSVFLICNSILKSDSKMVHLCAYTSLDVSQMASK